MVPFYGRVIAAEQRGSKPPADFSLEDREVSIMVH
jgi:hypothetical protein